MRRPAVFLAVAFLVGCAIGLRGLLEAQTALVGAVTAAVIYLAAFLPKLAIRSILRSIPLILSVILLGAWRGDSSLAVRGSWPDGDGSQVADYKGVISSDPEWEQRAGGPGVLHVELSLESGETVRTVLNGRGAGSVAYGDEVTVRGRCRSGKWGRRYLAGWVIARGAGGERDRNPLAEKLYGIRRRAASMLEFGIEDFPEQSGILKALVLGYRKGVPRETREVFIATGSLHVFAISGLHIGIACTFAVFILRALRVPPSRWFPFLAFLLVGYTIMTGASSSAVRACTMALVYFGGAFIGRKPDAISALAFSAVLLCGYDPWYLFDPGFVLSFVVATGICVLGGALAERMPDIGGPDPFLPKGEGRRSFLARSFTASAAVSISAWLASAPLMLFFFGRLAPVGIVSNLVIVPIAFVTVLSGCCSLLFGNISLIFSDLFNHASLGLIFALEGVIRMFARASLGGLRSVEMGLPGVLVWYALLGLLTAVLQGFFAPREKTLEIA